MGFQDSGIPGFWSSGVPGFWDSGFPGFWDSRILGFWHSGTYLAARSRTGKSRRPHPGCSRDSWRCRRIRSRRSAGNRRGSGSCRSRSRSPRSRSPGCPSCRKPHPPAPRSSGGPGSSCHWTIPDGGSGCWDRPPALEKDGNPRIWWTSGWAFPTPVTTTQLPNLLPKSQEHPERSQEHPGKYQEIPGKGWEYPTKSREIPAKNAGISLQLWKKGGAEMPGFSGHQGGHFPPP